MLVRQRQRQLLLSSTAVTLVYDRSRVSCLASYPYIFFWLASSRDRPYRPQSLTVADRKQAMHPRMLRLEYRFGRPFCLVDRCAAAQSNAARSHTIAV